MFAITGLVAMHEGWERILNPQTITNEPLALAILIIGLCTNSYALWLSYTRLKGSHPENSIVKAFVESHLIETKITFTLDLAGTSAAIIGIISILLYMTTGELVYDGIGAFLIGATVALFALFLVFESKDFLVGRSAQPEIEAAIEQAATSVEHVNAVLDLRTMYIGTERLLVNMEVDVATHLRTNDIEALMDEIKRVIKKEVPSVHHIQIELETA
jgi:cation diffusion facilitator family transporter